MYYNYYQYLNTLINILNGLRQIILFNANSFKIFFFIYYYICIEK